MAGTGAVLRGKDKTLARNTGTYASPTWAEVDHTKDVTHNGTSVEADATDADSTSVETVVIATSEEITGQLRYADANADYLAIRDAFFARTATEFAIFRGDMTVNGTKGRRMTCQVTQFQESYPQDGILIADFTLKPTPNANNQPEDITISA